MSDFIVRFHGIELSQEHKQRIQAAIQKAVVTEVSSASLSAYTPNPDDPGSGGGVLYWPPHWWLGIIYLPPWELGAVENLNKSQFSVNQTSIGERQI